MKKYIKSLYDLHYKYIYGLVYKRIANAEDTEDICQKVEMHVDKKVEVLYHIYQEISNYIIFDFYSHT